MVHITQVAADYHTEFTHQHKKSTQGNGLKIHQRQRDVAQKVPLFDAFNGELGICITFIQASPLQLPAPTKGIDTKITVRQKHVAFHAHEVTCRFGFGPCMPSLGDARLGWCYLCLPHLRRWLLDWKQQTCRLPPSRQIHRQHVVASVEKEKKLLTMNATRNRPQRRLSKFCWLNLESRQKQKQKNTFGYSFHCQCSQDEAVCVKQDQLWIATDHVPMHALLGLCACESRDCRRPAVLVQFLVFCRHWCRCARWWDSVMVHETFGDAFHVTLRQSK